MTATHAAIMGELRYAHTMVIGRITAVDEDAQRVDVQVLVRRGVPIAENEGIAYREFAPLRGVPLVTYRSGAASQIVKVVPGDWVEVRFAMHSIDELLRTDVNGPVDPQDPRNHDLLDAVAVPITFSPRPDTSAGADYEIIADDIRLGNPTTADPLVTDDGSSAGLQGQINILTDRVELAIAAHVNVLRAELNTLGVLVPVAGTAPVITPITVPKTTNVKGS